MILTSSLSLWPNRYKYGHHAKISDAKYRMGDFRQHILAISKLTNQASYQGVARIAQAKFVSYLRNKSKDKTGADWVAKEWTGLIKGHYIKADSGIPFVFRSEFYCVETYWHDRPLLAK